MDPFPPGEFLLPLFPLPNLVFFPNTRLPLHVFEPRYRQLVADVLERDSLGTDVTVTEDVVRIAFDAQLAVG